MQEQDLEVTEMELENQVLGNVDNLELQIKQEQSEYKKELTSTFLNEVKEFTEACFMLPKAKRENFITREKLKLNLYKMIRKQKKFKTSENIFNQIRYLAVFDKETNEIGKLIAIDFINQTAQYMTYYDKINNYENRNKAWKDIYLFDYNSIQLEAMFYQYHENHQRELSFTDMCTFLETKDFIKTKINYSEKIVHRNDEYGIELNKAEEHPIIKQIIIEYKIPESSIKKNKKRLLRINPENFEIIDDFASVKEAAEILNISASTISNVLCQGDSAKIYTEAGNFKWQYSDKLNKKYGNISEEINLKFNK